MAKWQYELIQDFLLCALLAKCEFNILWTFQRDSKAIMGDADYRHDHDDDGCNHDDNYDGYLWLMIQRIPNVNVEQPPVIRSISFIIIITL